MATGFVTQTVERQRTAMTRAGVSRPVAIALEDELIRQDTTFFDFGCGRGGDVMRLRQLKISAAGWDPAFSPDEPKIEADAVNLGYVLNVIEEPRERVDVVREAWRLARKLLIVSARLVWEGSAVRGVSFSDGILTTRGTFQKFYEHEELRDWLEGVLDVRVVAAGPGIFYVFRDTQEAQNFLASQVRRESVTATVRVNERLFDANRELLDELAAFVNAHQRLPSPDELPNGDVVVERFGSIRAAFAVIRLVTGQATARSPRVSERVFAENRQLLEELVGFLSTHGRVPERDELPVADQLIARFGSLKAATRLVENVLGAEQWQQVRTERRQELAVFLALAAFGGRARYSELSIGLQRDIRAIFGSYKSACEEADRLLFAAGDPEVVDQACRSASVGKLTSEALYVHRTALGLLPPVLRVFEGCGRVLAGAVPGATLVKLNREEPKVSYLSYPDFDSDPHPVLRAAVTVNLPRLKLHYRDYADSQNPPILHRKELFVPDGYPRRETFARLTRQEERAEVLVDPAVIGTQKGWEARLAARGCSLRGHRLVREASST